MAKNIAETRVTVYDVSINGADAGYVDEPEVVVKPTTKPIKLSAFMEQSMGSRLFGVEISIKLKHRQITAANLALCIPWGGGVLMPPYLGEDLYDYAVPIILHPRDLGADTTQDIELLKCVCTGGMNLSRPGTADDVIPTEWTAFPDRAELPLLVIGYLGSPI